MSSPNELLHSPCDIIRQLLVDGGVAVDPDFTSPADWSAYADSEPDRPERCITVYDTQGIDNGRVMIDGELEQHYGFQVRVRGRTAKEAAAKAASTRVYLSQKVKRRLVTVDGALYFVSCIAHIGQVLQPGKDTPVSKRNIVTLNATVALILTSAPTVIVEQAVGQTDPTTVVPINFTATFSEDVQGFTGSRVTLSGTAGATTAVVTGGPRVYNIAVSGMTNDGTVTCSLPANAGFNDLGVYSQASTSADNSVTYQLSPVAGMALWLRSDDAQASPNALTVASVSSQSLSSVDAAALRGGNTTWCLEAWFNATGTASGCLFGKGDYGGSTSGTEYSLEIDAGRFSLLVSRAVAPAFNVLSWSSLFASQTWYHILAWWDNSDQSMNICVNAGTPVKLVLGVALIAPGTLPLTVNHYPNLAAGFNNAQMQVIRKYHAVPDAGQRATLYNSGVPLLWAQLPSTLQALADVAWDLTGPGEADKVGGLALTPTNGPTYTEGIARLPAAALNDLVSFVADGSGNGRHAVQATPAAPNVFNHQPSFVPACQNGRPALRCDGRATFNDGTSWMNLASNLVLAGDFTVYATANSRVRDINAVHAVLLGGAAARLGDVQADDTIQFHDDTSGSGVTSTSTVPAGWHLWAFSRTGTTLKVYRDGIQVGVDVAFGAGALTLTELGAYNSGAGPWPWDLGEVLAYTSYHSPASPAWSQSHAYLRGRWFGTAYNAGPYFGNIVVGVDSVSLPNTPGALLLQDGSIYCYWNAGTDVNGTAAVVQAARSVDLGRTWGTPFQIWDSGQGGQREQSNLGAIQLASGRLLLHVYRTLDAAATVVRILKSDDNGATFQALAVVAPPPGYEALFNYGRFYELSPGGRILVPMYARAPGTGGIGSDQYDQWLYKSDDGGTSWQPFALIADGTSGTHHQFTEIGYAPTGVPNHWVCVMREDNNPQVCWTAFSSDNAATWTGLAPLPFKGVSCDVVLLPSGNLLLINADRTTSGHLGIRAFLSRDRGVTWGASYLVRDLTPHTVQGYPAAVLLPGAERLIWSPYFHGTVVGDTNTDVAYFSLHENDLSISAG